MQTLPLTDDEQIALSIALHQYLDAFDDATIASAHPTSTIARNVRTYNRLKNIALGNHVNYAVDRKPFNRLAGGAAL